jgi:cobalamin synthase
MVGLLAWIGAGAAALLAGRWITARLGGLTGDTYGALCELTEAVVLVALGLRIGGFVG